MLNADSQLARPAGVEKGSIFCLRHRKEPNKVEDRIPLVTPQLTHTSSLLHLPERNDSIKRWIMILAEKHQLVIGQERSGALIAAKLEKVFFIKDRVPEQYKAPAKREVHLWYCYTYLWECKSKIACCLLPISLVAQVLTIITNITA